MNGIFIQTEAKLFSLLLMIFLFVFIRKTSNRIRREDDFIYSFSITGILLSFLNIIAVNEYLQKLAFALSGCCYAVAVFFLCKSVFKKQGISPKSISLVASAAVGLLQFYCAHHGIGAATYLLCLAAFAIFAFDQFNKIRIDKLTGLYNRYGMDIEVREQLKQYKRKNTDSFYVIACDLDKFKHINDTWGHLEGDRALKLVSAALLKISEKFNSKAFRIGGDEFVIITDTSEEGLALEITNAIKEEFDSIVFRDDFDINISIGSALYDGVITISDLLDSADKKLYQAKKK